MHRIYTPMLDELVAQAPDVSRQALHGMLGRAIYADANVAGDEVEDALAYRGPCLYAPPESPSAV